MSEAINLNEKLELFYDANHGGAILPDALRWLWRRQSE